MNKTNYNSLHSMSKEELARFLSENVQYDGTPWEEWFDRNYCKKCFGAYCELKGKCKFFPDLDHIPNVYETILMWLELEQC